MHKHKFVFTPEHDAVCITCKFRFTRMEILTILAEFADDGEDWSSDNNRLAESTRN